MVAFRDGFANQFHHRLQFFCGAHDPGLDELQLWCDKQPEFLHRSLVLEHIANGVSCLGMSSDEIVLSKDRLEDGSEMGSETFSGSEEG